MIILPPLNLQGLNPNGAMTMVFLRGRNVRHLDLLGTDEPGITDNKFGITVVTDNKE